MPSGSSEGSGRGVGMVPDAVGAGVPEDVVTVQVLAARAGGRLGAVSPGSAGGGRQQAL